MLVQWRKSGVLGLPDMEPLLLPLLDYSLFGRRVSLGDLGSLE